jgi:hypothetical protein
MASEVFLEHSGSFSLLGFFGAVPFPMAFQLWQFGLLYLQKETSHHCPIE